MNITKEIFGDVGGGLMGIVLIFGVIYLLPSIVFAKLVGHPLKSESLRNMFLLSTAFYAIPVLIHYGFIIPQNY